MQSHGEYLSGIAHKTGSMSYQTPFKSRTHRSIQYHLTGEVYTVPFAQLEILFPLHICMAHCGSRPFSSSAREGWCVAPECI